MSQFQAQVPGVGDARINVSDAVTYGSKPFAQSAVTDRKVLAPTTGQAAYEGNGKIRFDIPVGQVGTYLDPSMTYLTFTVNNAGVDDRHPH